MEFSISELGLLTSMSYNVEKEDIIRVMLLVFVSNAKNPKSVDAKMGMLHYW